MTWSTTAGRYPRRAGGSAADQAVLGDDHALARLVGEREVDRDAVRQLEPVDSARLVDPPGSGGGANGASENASSLM